MSEGAKAGRGRVPYTEAGKAGRDVLRRAAMARLSPKEHRVLEAILAQTVLYSRLTDRTYLGHLAAHAHGVEWAKPWMLEKTRLALVALRDAGLIDYRAPKGRPNTGTDGPAYVVSIPVEKDHPETGGDTEETPPDDGCPFDGETPPDLVRNTTRSQRETPPENGGPTEKVSEEVSEQPPTSPSVVPTASDERSTGRSAEDEVEARVKREARRQWTERNRRGEGLGIAVLRLIEQDIRDEWANREASSSDATGRQLLESYTNLGRNRARMAASEDDLRAELAGDPNVMRMPDLLHAALCGLRGQQVIH